MDIDASGRVYVTGDYPNPNPPYDLFLYVTSLNAAGSGFYYWWYRTGSEDDTGRGIVVDQQENVFVIGYTSSTNFPVTPGALDVTYNGGLNDLVLLKFDPGGIRIFTTFLGGNNWDFCEDGIAPGPER